MKKWLIILSLIFVACAASGWTVLFVTGVGPYDLPVEARNLDAELERSRKLGLPMAQAELKKHPSPAENAAFALGPILNATMLDPLSDAANDYSKGGVAGEANARKQLAAFKGDLDLVVATKGPFWEVDRDYDYGPHVLFPEFAAMKSLCKGLGLRARVAAKEGRVNDALTDLEAMRKLGKWLYQEPSLIGLLVAVATESITFRAYEDIAYEWRGNAEELERLAASLEGEKWGMTLERAFRGEFFLCVAIGRNLDNMGGLRAAMDPNSASVFRGPPVRSGKPTGMVNQAQLTPIVRIYNDVFEKYNGIGWDKPGAGAFVDKAVVVKSERMTASFIMGAVVFPVMTQAGESLVKREVLQELTTLLIRARIAKTRTGSWPAITAVDPYNAGKPYRSKVEGDSIQIWSVGKDGVDDGGYLSYKDIYVASPRPKSKLRP